MDVSARFERCFERHSLLTGDLRGFRAIPMISGPKYVNFHAPPPNRSTRCFSVFAIFDVPDPSIFVIFDDFDNFFC